MRIAFNISLIIVLVLLAIIPFLFIVETTLFSIRYTKETIEEVKECFVKTLENKDYESIEDLFESIIFLLIQLILPSFVFLFFIGYLIFKKNGS